MNLAPDADLRRPEHRRETFLRFYEFHLKHRTHPGCVYFLMPWLAEAHGWDGEQRAWFAFINGNTQHPVTSLAIMQAAPTIERADDAIAFWQEHYADLAWDADRRYHRKDFANAIGSYRALLGDQSQVRFWSARSAWPAAWKAARSVATFGRLSAFSFLEYLRIMGLEIECESLMLDDRFGSRSHRNGLCILDGLDDLDWHKSNPRFNGVYEPEVLAHLEQIAWGLIVEMKERANGADWRWDVNLFTLESALCTYKSWHRPNRRYPNVYADMLHERISTSTAPGVDLDEFWQARADSLPPRLLLERTPTDPGRTAIKANHYLLTGRTVMIGTEDRTMESDFDRAVAAGTLGLFR